MCRRFTVMEFGSWDTAFNLVLLLFWYQIWAGREHADLFNPYLAPMIRIADSVMHFLRPVFFSTPREIVAAISLVFALVLRGLAVPTESAGTVAIGFEIRTPYDGEIWSCILLSFLSFGVFAFKLWGISLIYVHGRQASRFNHASSTLYSLARPFADMPRQWRPVVLLVTGTALGILLDLAGVPPPGAPAAAGTGHLIQCVISAVAGWVNVLMILQSALIVLIIGSWISMFMASHGLMFFCREWIDLILGPLRRYPMRIGMLDLTPIVFFFGVSIVHGILQGILWRSYQGLP